MINYIQLKKRPVYFAKRIARARVKSVMIRIAKKAPGRDHPAGLDGEERIKMKIGIAKTVEVEAKTLEIYMKVCDHFKAHITDQDGALIGKNYEGYVPDLMPGKHFGDYLILNIDLETGVVKNWKAPTKEQVEFFINHGEE